VVRKSLTLPRPDRALHDVRMRPSCTKNRASWIWTKKSIGLFTHHSQAALNSHI
jgi:hypothetical protein